MTRSMLPDPVPRQTPLPFHPFAVVGIATLFLPTPQIACEVGITSILERRRTRRTFGPLPIAELATLLWHTVKSQRFAIRSDGSEMELCPLPSAGGCNCVSVVVIQTPGLRPEVSLYEPRSHSLRELDSSCIPFRKEVASVLDPGTGTILIFAGDTQKLESRYSDGESLGWRDAGVLLGGMALVAEALELAFCPLGISGQSIVRVALNDGRFQGYGGCVIGARTT